MCVGLDRWAGPTPKVVVDRSQAEAMGLTDADVNLMIDDAEAQAQAFLATEQSYLVETGVVKFESYETSPYLYSQGPMDIIKLCDSQIASSFLTQFADLGNTETGARSVGEIHLSVFRRAAINLCDIVAAQISGPDRRGGGTIGRLIRWNYGCIDPSKLPKLKHPGLDTDDLAESMGMLPQLVQAGILTPDDELERAISERLGAGDLPDEASRSAIERTTSAKGGLAAFTERLVRAKHG